MSTLYHPTPQRGMLMFRVVLGCLHSGGHVDPRAGIFGILDERFRNLRRSKPIPASANTQCSHRRTPQCNQDCRCAVYGIMVGHRISYQNKGTSL